MSDKEIPLSTAIGWAKELTQPKKGIGKIGAQELEHLSSDLYAMGVLAGILKCLIKLGYNTVGDE